MNRSIGNQRHREQSLGGRKPQITHDDHHGVVVHVEEGQPSRSRPTENDQKGIEKLNNLGEIEDVSPEEDGSTRRRSIGREANDPSPISLGHLVEGGEGAADGHYKGEKEEEEVVEGGDEAEGGGGECGEKREIVERESESEVSEDSESEEKR